MSSGNENINIAIDGPAGAGKSTVARRAAEALGYIYIDTGAMYRAVTWICRQRQIRPDDEKSVRELLEHISMEIKRDAKGQRIYIDGREVTSFLRTNEISNHVSSYARNSEVRRVLVVKQKEMARHKGIVMDGRDIATHVLPDAEVKIFLTASVERRAERRLAELQDEEVTLDQLKREIEERDQADRNRKFSPLVIAPDAVVVDTTDLTIEETVAKILHICRQWLKR